jgi:hypothetical protein
MQLVIRVFVEVGDVSEAEAIAGVVEASLRPIATVSKTSIRPYWKISEYTEVLLVFDLRAAAEAAMAAATNLLAEGWMAVSDSEALWTGEGGATAKVAGLRWGQVEVHG